MNAENVGKRLTRNKIRKITACSECHRRKQKCDRQKPCNFCIDRGVTSKCFYRTYDDKLQRSPDNAREHNRDLSSDHGLDDDISHTIGYALSSPCHSSLPAGTSTNERSAVSGRRPLINAHQSRKLQSLVQRLPRPEIVQDLVQVFFSEANWYFTVLEGYYFHQTHRSWTRTQAGGENDAPAEILCFPALLFQVIAIGAQFVPPPLANKVLTTVNLASLDDVSAMFSDTGEKILNLIGRHSHAITAVEADLMRCAWLKNCGRGTEAWYSLGNAVRQAQDQSLHQEPRSSSSLTEQWEAERRRRLWACIFSWESHMALQLGRARMINAGDCTSQSPIDCDMPLYPSRTLFTAAASHEPPSHFTSAMIKYRLAQMIHELMNLRALKPDYPDYSIITKAHTKVDSIIQALPAAVHPTNPDTSWDVHYPEIVKHRLQISIITHSFLLALHRPHISHQTSSLSAAITAAITVLSESQNLFEITAPHQYKIYTSTFYTIDTGMLLSAILAKLDPTHPQRKPAMQALRQAVRRLSILKARNPAAGAGERALVRFLDKLDLDATNNMAVPGTALTTDVTINDSGGGPSTRRDRQSLATTTTPQEISTPLSTDPLRTMQSLMSPRPTTAAVSATGTPAVSSSSTDQLEVRSSSYNICASSAMAGDDDADAMFARLINDSAYTASWLEEAGVAYVEGGEGITPASSWFTGGGGSNEASWYGTAGWSGSGSTTPH